MKQKLTNALHVASVVFLPLASFPVGRSFHLMLSKQIGLYAIGVLALMLWIIHHFHIPEEERKAAENRFLVLYLLFLMASILSRMIKRPLLGSKARRDGVLMFFNYIAIYFLARRARVDGDKVIKGFVSLGSSPCSRCCSPIRSIRRFCASTLRRGKGWRFH